MLKQTISISIHNPQEAEILKPYLKDPKKLKDFLLEYERAQHATVNQVQREKTILDVAGELVYGSRNKAYGHPKDNFGNIAKLQNGYLSIVSHRSRQRGMNVVDFNDDELSEIDIAIMNILQKCAHLATNQTHMDNVVDIAGYAATIERIIANK